MRNNFFIDSLNCTCMCVTWIPENQVMRRVMQSRDHWVVWSQNNDVHIFYVYMQVIVERVPVCPDLVITQQ